MSASKRLAAELRAAHPIQVSVIDADLSTEAGVTHLLHAADALDAEIDHLISNAGFGFTGPFLTAEPERQSAMVRLNCEAVMRLARHFLPGMVARGRGGIVHLASAAAFQPVPYFATYAATKAFVLSFSCALAEEVRSSGVRVMALCPGPVPSGFQAASNYRLAKQDALITLSSAETVRRGLASYEGGNDVCVTGGMNRVLAFLSRFTPRRLGLRLMAKIFAERAAR